MLLIKTRDDSSKTKTNKVFDSKSIIECAIPKTIMSWLSKKRAHNANPRNKLKNVMLNVGLEPTLSRKNRF